MFLAISGYIGVGILTVLLWGYEPFEIIRNHNHATQKWVNAWTRRLFLTEIPEISVREAWLSPWAAVTNIVLWPICYVTALLLWPFIRPYWPKTELS